MDNPLIIFAITAGLIFLSAFFVAVEFALISAKRHRLEDAALHSTAARAALRSSSELTVLLAGSQLGITVCTLALGAVTKPAVHYALTPAFESWGLSYVLADVVGFVLALVIVTFLHLVVGEMAPKSWAIAHPERSAMLLALPMRGFMWIFRPVLRLLNGAANWCLRRVGVDPDERNHVGQNSDDLLQLVEHSVSVGSLDADQSTQLSKALELESLTVADLIHTGTVPTSVSSSAVAADVRAASIASGHRRILVRDHDDVKGVVHVRDTLAVDESTSVLTLMREMYELPATMPVYNALAELRERSIQLALVRDDAQQVLGVVSLVDIVERLFRVEEPAA